MTEAFLGAGTFGRVEKCLYNGHWYARKHMLSDSDDEGVPYTALRECDIYSRFTHPFMVSVYRMEIVQHRVRLWMGLADMTVADYLSQSYSFPDRQTLALQVAWNVLNVLRYLHAYHMLHRDVKPDNILLRRSGTGWYVYLSDMGASRNFQRGGDMTSGMGTRYYRPPEMYTKTYGKPSDVYALGCTLIHLLHGDLPAKKQTERCPPSAWLDLLQQHKDQMSSPFYELLRRLIYSHPNKRITVHQALQHACFQGVTLPPLPKMEGEPWPGDYTLRVGLQPIQRQLLVEWLLDIGYSHGYQNTTLAHAVHLLDDFFAHLQSGSIIDRRVFHLYTLVSLWVAGKYFEAVLLSLQDLISVSKEQFLREDFIVAEENLLSTLRFRIVRRPVPVQITQVRKDLSSLQRILGHIDYTQGKITDRASLRVVPQTENAISPLLCCV